MSRVVRPRHVVSPSNGGKLRCSSKECRRTPLWKVNGELKCNRCFDKWAEANWDKFEPDTIERLSDKESDFEFVKEPLCRVPRSNSSISSGAEAAEA